MTSIGMRQVFYPFLVSVELSASIFHIIRVIFLQVYIVKPFSHLAPKAYTLSNSYSLQGHRLLLKTRLQVKKAKLESGKKSQLFLLNLTD